MRRDVEISTAHLRVGKGELDSAFFGHATSRSTETITNPANGKFFVIEGHSLFQATKATRVEGTIFQFTAVEAGQPFVLRDMSGRLLLRDRGAIRITILFDTLGDDTPGGVGLEELDVRVAGPHPAFCMDQAVVCAGVQELIG